MFAYVNLALLAFPVCIQSSFKKDRFSKDTEEWERARVRLRSSAAQLNEEDAYENPYVAEPHEVLIESRDVVVGEPLGEGAYGRVFRGQWKNKNTGVVVSGRVPPCFWVVLNIRMCMNG